MRLFEPDLDLAPPTRSAADGGGEDDPPTGADRVEMKQPKKVSLRASLDGVTYLPQRTPEMALTGGVEAAFAELAACGDGAVYAGHYSGDSEWERHPAGDEVVLALAGTTTLVLWIDGREERVPLAAEELVVVPRGTWHRFEASRELQVLTVTPQPTEQRVERPEAR
jgi:mannose-6-phosphate isomerase-like protein (cupin superfamily)